MNSQQEISDPPFQPDAFRGLAPQESPASTPVPEHEGYLEVSLFLLSCLFKRQSDEHSIIELKRDAQPVRPRRLLWEQ